MVAGADRTAAAVADLSSRAVSLQGECAASAAHLRAVADTVTTLARTSATSIEVQHHISELGLQLSKLHDGATQRVLQGCAAMHAHLDGGLAHVAQQLEGVARTTVALEGIPRALEEVLAGQGRLAAAQDETRECMQLVRSVMEQLQEQFTPPPGFSMFSGRNLLVRCW